MPTPAQIKQALEVILCGKVFARAGRSRALLSYLIEQTLAGKGHQLKGYTIGIAVFGREPDFDPQDDNIVRINGGRLRKRLEKFYRTDEGKHCPVVIDLPKRSYVPQFYFNEDAVAASQVLSQASPQDVSEPAAQTTAQMSANSEAANDETSESLQPSSLNQNSAFDLTKPITRKQALLMSTAVVLSLLAIMAVLLLPGKNTTPVKSDKPVSAELQLADNFFGVQNYHQALKHYRSALAQDPDNIDLLRQIARCQLNLNQIAQANETLRKILILEAAEQGEPSR